MIRRAEGTQAEAAAEGLAHVRVKEADAAAQEKQGMVEARIREAQVAVSEKEGTVIAENVRRKALAEAQGREAEAIAIEKTGLAQAVGKRENLLAEVSAKQAEAGAIEARMMAEAHGIAEKANAMKQLDGQAREHEEYRLRLDNDRVIALEQIKARVQMTEQQAKVMAEAMTHADIKIVGGDGQFFDRFVRAVSLGSSIDGVVENSEVARKLLADHTGSSGPSGGNGGGGGNGRAKLLADVKDMVRAASGGASASSAAGGTATVQSLLSSMLPKADDAQKNKLAALLEQAKQLGAADDKVS